MRPLRGIDPTIVGPYRLAARLGSGGMGMVFLGVDAAGRPAAVKVLRDEHAGDQMFLRRFAKEVRAAAAVRSARVARLVDADPDGETPWLATEYIPGPTLLAMVADHGPMPAEALESLARGLAEALRAIHDVGVVHRDLKPANVVLAEDGPKVIDFGIAAGLPGSVTATGLVLGSVGYMAPELLTTTGRPEPAADIFSWGLTLTFAATARPPFGDGPLEALLYRTLHDDPAIAGIPRRLRSIVTDAVRKEPDRRPSAPQLLDRLSALGGPVRITAAPAPRPRPAPAPPAAVGAAEWEPLVVDGPRSSGARIDPTPSAGVLSRPGRRARVAGGLPVPALPRRHRRTAAATAIVLTAACAVIVTFVPSAQAPPGAPTASPPAHRVSPAPVVEQAASITEPVTATTGASPPAQAPASTVRAVTEQDQDDSTPIAGAGAGAGAAPIAAAPNRSVSRGQHPARPPVSSLGPAVGCAGGKPGGTGQGEPAASGQAGACGGWDAKKPPGEGMRKPSQARGEDKKPPRSDSHQSEHDGDSDD